MNEWPTNLCAALSGGNEGSRTPPHHPLFSLLPQHGPRPGFGSKAQPTSPALLKKFLSDLLASENSEESPFFSL